MLHSFSTMPTLRTGPGLSSGRWRDTETVAFCHVRAFRGMIVPIARSLVFAEVRCVTLGPLDC